jgi:hypothetical protein
MQHEFNNRVGAQRAILHAINCKPWNSEQLFGLSSRAIDRWVSVNRIDPSSRVVKLIRDLSAKLFFLANKSQQQVSEEYIGVRAEIATACDDIMTEVEGTAAENHCGR